MVAFGFGSRCCYVAIVDVLLLYFSLQLFGCSAAGAAGALPSAWLVVCISLECCLRLYFFLGFCTLLEFSFPANMYMDIDMDWVCKATGYSYVMCNGYLDLD